MRLVISDIKNIQQKFVRCWKTEISSTRIRTPTFDTGGRWAAPYPILHTGDSLEARQLVTIVTGERHLCAECGLCGADYTVVQGESRAYGCVCVCVSGVDETGIMSTRTVLLQWTYKRACRIRKRKDVFLIKSGSMLRGLTEALGDIRGY